MLVGMPEHRFVHRDLVQFSDTDMAGIVHFSNFFRFMERAEHAFFRSLGLSIVERPGTIPTMEGNPVGWPRVHASCDFFTPLFFEDEVEVELLVEELRTRSIRYLFRVRKLDGTLAAEGRIAAVCVQKDKEKGGMKAVEIPARVKDKLESAPAEVLGAGRKG
jgi:acyl-CoA thioester hydrolase